MHEGSGKMPNFEQVAQLLQSGENENVTVSAGQVTVTVSPKMELLSIVFSGPGVVEEHREALQNDTIEAMNKAHQTAVVASAKRLEKLRDLPEMKAFAESLKEQLRRSPNGL